MENKYGVKITYRNERLEPTNEKTYLLEDYAQSMRIDLLHLINDIETVFYEIRGNCELNIIQR